MLLSLLIATPADYRLHVDQVPAEYREIAIFTGYRRPNCTIWRAIASAFWSTNEGVNFWTHFLPSWYFLVTFRRFCTDTAFVADPYHWPFLVFLSITCLWPLVSCFAHLFNVISIRARYFSFFCDYLALSVYSFGCATVYNAYSVDAAFLATRLSRIYLYAATVAALLVTILTCESRFMLTSPFSRKLTRMTGLVLGYSAAQFPLVERMFSYLVMPPARNGNEQLDDAFALTYYHRQIICTVIGSVLYALHIPELVLPGKFDIVGNSHQIMHVLAVVAAYHQVWACYADLKSRRRIFQTRDNLKLGQTSIALLALVLIADIVIVAAYAMRVIRRLESHVQMPKND